MAVARQPLSYVRGSVRRLIPSRERKRAVAPSVMTPRLVVNRDHVGGGLRRYAAYAGHYARVSIADAGRHVYVDLDQSSTDDSREIHGRGLSADRNRHSVREPVGARKHLPGWDGWIRGTKSRAPQNDHLARAWRAPRCSHSCCRRAVPRCRARLPETGPVRMSRS